MTPNVVKRHASRSPVGSRASKRPATSSPEEGELDDPSPPRPSSSSITSTLPPLPPSLPQKPVAALKAKVPFPFKKKHDSGINGLPSVVELGGHSISMTSVYERADEGDRRGGRDNDFKRKGRGHHQQQHQQRQGDHWEPGQSRGDHYAPRRDHRERERDRDRADRDRERDRERARSPSSLPPGSTLQVHTHSSYSPNRSRSPLSPHREKHRLPAPRTPEPSFSPMRNGYGGGGRDRDWGGRSLPGSGPRDRRYRDDDDDRHYRPDSHADYRSRGGDSWSRRDDYDSDRRSYRPDDHDRDSERPRRHDSYRPVSPGPSTRSGGPTTPPLPRSSTPPPESQPSPSQPASQSTEPQVPDSSEPQSQSQPLSQSQEQNEPPEPPPALHTPPPPSCSPPPAPPPDIRLQKTAVLPERHALVSIQMKKPGAPRGDHSPPAMVIPNPMAQPPPPPVQLPEKKVSNSIPNGVLPEKPKFEIDDKSQTQDSGGMKGRVVRKREIVKRSRKEEKEAYGRTFVGCGQQADYEVTTKLGEGTFGEVHKAIHKNTEKAVALKRILMHNEKEGMPVTALREIKILKALKHPCIVEILDMFVVRSSSKDPLSVYMVFPYMDHDLAGLLENERVKLQPSHIKLYMKQLLEGTAYMHRNNILHRDMKAANLLISNSGSLRIADFGLARAFDQNVTRGGTDHRGRERKYTNCVVTRWYRPPELLLGARQYGGEVDIWGIGCVLGEMFTRRPILPGTSDLDQLEKIWVLCGTPNQHTWPNFDALPGCEGVKRFTSSHPRRIKSAYESVGTETCDLLDKLLTCNPRERITAVEALDHDYFWTDPLPADPKTLPQYEASHEFDKRGHRNQHPHPPPPGPTNPDPHHLPQHPVVPHPPPPPPQHHQNHPRPHPGPPGHPPPAPHGPPIHFGRGGHPPHQFAPPIRFDPKNPNPGFIPSHPHSHPHPPIPPPPIHPGHPMHFPHGRGPPLPMGPGPMMNYGLPPPPMPYGLGGPNMGGPPGGFGGGRGGGPPTGPGGFRGQPRPSHLPQRPVHPLGRGGGRKNPGPPRPPGGGGNGELNYG